jgi:hypothetical protein
MSYVDMDTVTSALGCSFVCVWWGGGGQLQAWKNKRLVI